ncbi:MAG: hypothetical protein AAGD13_17605 [Pseudomonadota bacterium]
MIGLAGEAYAFGPFALTLPEGWSAEKEDGIHELLPEHGDYALHLSGYDKDVPVTQDDLAAVAHEHGCTGTPAELSSGLSAVSFDRAEDGDAFRYWAVGHGTAMLLVTLTAPEASFAMALMRAELVVRSLRPAEETV